MTKRKTLALIAVTACFFGNLLMAATASAQEPTAATASAQEPIALPAAPPIVAAAPENAGLLAPFLARPAGDAAPGDQRFWFTSDYQFAFLRGANVPALVTTSPAGTDRAVAGTLGGPGTTTLFGAQGMNGDLRSGLNLAAGYWFGGDSPFGFETSFTLIQNQNSDFAANSNQYPILARPYTNAADRTQQALLVAFPGSSTGSIDARVGSGDFFGGSFDITEKALDFGWYKLVAMVGYRFFHYDESVNVHQNLTETNPAFGAGTQAVTNDSFGANNMFNGLDLGFRTQFTWDQFSLEVLTRCAFGDLQRRLAIDGSQVVTVPGLAPVIEKGGVLALPTNIGNYTSHDWRALPEVGLNFAWQIRPNMKLRAGYSFLLLSGVARAVDQIDTTVNPNFLPPSVGGGPTRPVFSLQRTDMWIQTINVGLEFNF